MELRVFLLEDLRGMRLLLDDLFASMGQYRVVSAVSTEAETTSTMPAPRARSRAPPSPSTSPSITVPANSGAASADAWMSRDATST